MTARLHDVLETNVDEKYYLSEEKTAKLIETLEDRVKVKEATKQALVEPRIIELGKIKEHRNSSVSNSIHSTEGLCSTLDTAQGGGREPKIAEPQEFTDGSGISYCIDASYAKGTSVGNVGKGRRAHAIEVRATLTPDRVEKRQNGRRFKDEDEPMFTLTAQDKHGILEKSPNYRIRKLTPLETWRLQDFADEQFHKAKTDGVSDSQLYKQAGNSVTVKVVEMIARQIENRNESEEIQ